MFHRGAEWISTPWKGTNTWFAESTASLPTPQVPFLWGVMARGYHLDYFSCSWNAVPQHSGKATSPSPAAKRSWKWTIAYCKSQAALSRVSEVSLQHKGATEEAGASARFPVLPCGALRHWKCGSLPQLIISLAPERAGPGTALCWHSCTAATS